MSNFKEEDTSPATKADIAAFLERLDHIERRFASIDERFDMVDRQFDNLPACFSEEGTKIRLHADRVGRETRRHVDATDASLTNFIRGILDIKSLAFGEKFREQDRRIRALERREQPATVS